MNLTTPITEYLRVLDLLYLSSIVAGLWILVFIQERRSKKEYRGRHVD